MGNTWKSHYVIVNDIKLHYTRTGGQKPPLILSHGLSDNGLCWSPVATQLEKSYDVIMVDARGHGLSDAFSNHSLNIMADDLLKLIKALDLNKPILMGHSMGAQISAYAAAIEPLQIKSLILEDPATLRIPSAFTFIVKKVWKITFKQMFNQLKGLTPEEIQTKCRKQEILKTFQVSPKWSDEEIEHFANAKIQFMRHKPDNLLESVIESLSFDWYGMLKNIQCPVLLITSEKGKTKKKIAKKLIDEVWDNGKWVDIKNAGHNIRRDNYEDFMKTINAFLTS